MLIDTHAHLTDTKFENLREQIIENMPKDRLEKVFCVAYNLESIKQVFELSQEYENVYAIIGIHPEEVDDLTEDTINLIKKLSSNPKVIAIGEIGLDYHYPNYDKAISFIE